MSCSEAAGTGCGPPRGWQAPAHGWEEGEAGRSEKGWPGTRALTRAMVLGKKATNVDTWEIWSNRHKGAWNPGFSHLRERKYQHGW